VDPLLQAAQRFELFGQDVFREVKRGELRGR
jgi:hypothetical protein